MEIERKFSLHRLPEHLEQYEKLELEQGYLCTSPVVRIRKQNDIYYLTYKSKVDCPKEKETAAIVNQEVELPLTEEAYLHLRSKIDGNLILKTRYRIPIEEELIVELDVFHGKLQGLCFAEVEFPNENKAKQFQLLDWMKEDVSFDHRYHNSNLSKIDSVQNLLLS